MIAWVALATIQGAGKRDVSLGEAAAAAVWFFKCVGANRPVQVTGISYVTGERSTYGGVPRYHVEVRLPGIDWPYDVQVDAVSGRVMFVSDLHAGPPFSHPPKAISDRWLKRLGAPDLAYDAQLGRYDLRVGRAVFCNLNGDSQASFLMQDGHFAWYLGPADPPPLPSTPPRVTVAQAESAAVAERMKTVPHWSEKLVTRTSPALFYDDQAGEAKWAWKVLEGTVRKGVFQEGWTHFVDAQTGAVIPEERVSWSRLIYRSGPPRSGLVHVPLQNPISAMLRLVSKKMRQLGRPESDPQSVSFGNTIEARYDDFVQVTMKPNGDLLKIFAEARPGRMADDRALAYGRKLILEQHPKLAEGRFELDSRPGWMFSKVDYVQTAYGYPYLDHNLVTLEFDGKGTVSNYVVEKALPRPEAPPGRLVTPDEAMRIATAAAQATISASGSNQSLMAPVAKNRPPVLGWLQLADSTAVRLVYRISVPYSKGGQFSHMLLFWTGIIDAQTGKVLESSQNGYLPASRVRS